MLTFIEGLPDDVLGIEAIGNVTHQDYRDILVPKAEAMIGKGPIKMLYLVGEQSTGYELEALWDDGAFGIKHWRHFERVAVVTDRAWLRAAVSMFAPLMPATVRLFAVSELPAAKDWIVSAKQASA